MFIFFQLKTIFINKNKCDNSVKNPAHPERSRSEFEAFSYSKGIPQIPTNYSNSLTPSARQTIKGDPLRQYSLTWRKLLIRWHDGLIRILFFLNTPLHFLRHINNYISNCSMFFAINIITSPLVTLNYNLPQGSSISHILFILCLRSTYT